MHPSEYEIVDNVQVEFSLTDSCTECRNLLAVNVSLKFNEGSYDKCGKVSHPSFLSCCFAQLLEKNCILKQRK